MTGFVIGAVLLLGATLLLLLWPLLWPMLSRAPRPGSGARDQAASDAAIIAGFRTQLADLQVERDRGTLAAEGFEQSRRELEQRLLGELARAAASRVQSAGGEGGRGAGDQSAVPRWSAWTWVGACGAVIVLPLVLYAQFGVPDGLRPAMADQSAAAAGGQGDGGAAGRAGEITPAQVEVMIGKLEEHLKEAPQDAEGWTMLGRAYNFLQRFELASSAYAKAIALRPDDPQLLADGADALAMANGRTLAGAPMELIGRALKIDPANPKALALAGTNAFDQRDYAAAIGFWERAAKVAGQDPEFVAALNNSVAEARARSGGGPGAAGGAAAAAQVAASAAASAAPGTAPGAAAPPGGASVSGRVTLAPAIASRAGPDDTVFVFARAEQGPRIPLALMRRQVKDLPIDFALDESMAMMPQMSLAKFPTVVVGARISKSGTAAPLSGDLQGFSVPVKVGARGVRVEISEVVP